MKRIILDNSNRETLMLSEVVQTQPIFAKEDGEFIGMVVKDEDKGWFLALGGERGAVGYHKTLRDLLECCESYDYEFLVN
jgi:hypothetical protein